ncbi:ABIL3-like protein [Drosera capensis]
METLNTSASLPIHLEPSEYDEISMQHNLLFGDSLKDLKDLRTQLYSAAEYFEQSFTNDNKKQIVVNTLRDYAVKALVNTVDHLGSVTYKVNDLVNEKVEEVSGTEFRVSCIEQRLQTCQECIDREGLAQQSSIIDTPRAHKRYTFPAENLNGKNNAKSKGYGMDDEDWPLFRSARIFFAIANSAIRATSSRNPTIQDTTIQETPRPPLRKGCSPSPSSRPSQLPGSFSFTCSISKNDLDQRAISLQHVPLFRSGSVAARPMTPKPSRSTSPSPALDRQWRYPTVPPKSASMRAPDDRSKNMKVLEKHPSKGKRLLKALLTRRKYKKDDLLYTYLDEYY